MHVSIQKWGNSLALRIPRAMAQDLELGRGAVVNLKLKKKTLMLTPVPKRSWSLKRLLSGVTERHLHRETETGKPMGREAW
jgi:antitoxin MazE